MAGNSESADLIDPGAHEKELLGTQMPTDSQIRLFCEEEFSHHAPNTAGRKRKGERSVNDGNSFHKRQNVQLLQNSPVDLAQAPTNTRESISAQESAVPTDNDDADSRVILIRPANEDAKKMLTSPEQLCLALEGPPFNTLQIKDVRVNRRKGLIAVELVSYHEASIKLLLQLTQLGAWPVTCTQSNQGKFCYGVIGPIEVNSDTSTLVRRVDSCSSGKLVKMERLSRTVDGKRVPSTSVRVVFEGRDLPAKIKIGYLSYPIRAYEFPPLQCYRCQRFKHSANGCTSKMRCLVCAEEHHFSTCHSRVFKCANCGGPHKANSPECDLVIGSKAYWKSWSGCLQGKGCRCAWGECSGVPAASGCSGHASVSRCSSWVGQSRLCDRFFVL